MPTLFCFGLGNTARTLAPLLKGWTITGTTRDPDKAATLASQGIQPHIFDAATPNPTPNPTKNPAITNALTSATHVLISIPPDQHGCPAHRRHHTDIYSPVTYLSSTAVYGDHAGAWVTEDSPTNPTTDLGENRLTAERQWRNTHPSTTLLRIAAIYGPGRSPIDHIRAGRGTRLDHPHPISRIHTHDLARLLARLITATITDPATTTRQHGETYNIADTQPTTPLAFTDAAYDLLNLPKPPAISPDHPAIPDITRKHLKDNKRVDASKIRRALNTELTYPTPAEGLRQCLDAAATSDPV